VVRGGRDRRVSGAVDAGASAAHFFWLAPRWRARWHLKHGHTKLAMRGGDGTGVVDARGLSVEVLRAVGDAHAQRHASTIQVGVPGTRRIIGCEGGFLVASASEFPADRIGEQLAGEGRLDAALIGPLGEEARRTGRLLGEVLIQEGLTTPAELAEALTRQLKLNFTRALVTPGPVTVSLRPPARRQGREPLAASLVAFFRDVDPDEFEARLGRMKLAELGLRGKLEELGELGLLPAELRAVRLLASGRLEELPTEGPMRLSARRLFCALSMLGLLIAR
jgi:hypothetical protein